MKVREVRKAILDSVDVWIGAMGEISDRTSEDYFRYFSMGCAVLWMGRSLGIVSDSEIDVYKATYF